MTRTGKIVVGVLVTFAALGVVAVVGYVLYVVVILALLHAAFYPSCPESDEKLTKACTELSRRDPAVHCSSSREGPMPSGPQGVCEAFNRVELEWEPNPDAGYTVNPRASGAIVETKDVYWDAGRARDCDAKGFTFYLAEPAPETSPGDITRIHDAFDKACTAFRR